jgi:FtsP/CotA-like multicopper oxidase with cupredoxin domain
MYHCHQEADIHVTMGMVGAMVIYPPTDTGHTINEPGKPGSLWGWNYNREYIMLLTDTDTRIHASEAQGAGGGNAFNMVNYQPQYWFVNGLSFPQTIHAAVVLPGVPAWLDWKAAHPGMDPFIQGVFNDKVLLRVVNLGFETQPMHMHGFHAKVLGGDQREWPWAQPGGPNNATGTGMEKNTITIGSGETYELLYDFSQQNPTSTYPDTALGSQTRYDNAAGVNLNKPVVNTDTAKPAIPDPFSPGFAYQAGPNVGGTQVGPAGQLPVILADTSQYFPFHNHDDYSY